MLFKGIVCHLTECTAYIQLTNGDYVEVATNKVEQDDEIGGIPNVTGKIAKLINYTTGQTFTAKVVDSDIPESSYRKYTKNAR